MSCYIAIPEINFSPGADILIDDFSGSIIPLRNNSDYRLGPIALDPNGAELANCGYYVYYLTEDLFSQDIDTIFATSSGYLTKYKYQPPGSKIWNNNNGDNQATFDCPNNFGDPGDRGVYGVGTYVLDLPETKSGSYNSWIGSGGSREIFVNSNSVAPKFSYSVTANHKYSFTFEVYGEDTNDGIMVSTNDRLVWSSIYMNDSAAPNTSGYIAHCVGINGRLGNTPATKTVNWTAPSTTTIYVYFRTDSTNLYGPRGTSDYEYGQIDIVDLGAQPVPVTITFNKNGGSGGTDTLSGYSGETTAQIGNGRVSIPSKSGANGSFNFRGYFDSTSSNSTIRYNSWGYAVAANAITISSNTTFYAQWINRVNYSPSSSVRVWATTDSNTSSTTLVGSRSVTIASSSWYSSTGTISISSITSGFSISNNGRTLNIPSGTTNGTVVQFTLITTGSGTDYIGTSESYTIRVYVDQNYVTDTYSGELIIDQKAPIPASGITLSNDNINTYFEAKRYGEVIQYANGYESTQTQTIPVEERPGVNIADEDDWNTYEFTIPGLGTTCKESTLVEFSVLFPDRPKLKIYGEYVPVDDGEDVEVYDPGVEGVEGVEGGDEGVVDMDYYWGERYNLTQAGNYATLTLIKGADPIIVNGTTSLTIRADFTSGASIPDVTDNLSIATDPVNKVDIY